jgi:serine/threonine protein kinase
VLLSQQQPGSSLERHLRAHTALSDTDVIGLAAFMTPLLAYNPAERPSAAQMLQHAWLQSDLSSSEGDDAGPAAGGREAQTKA